MSYLPEMELDFTVPLKDVSVPEKKQAKFECTINKDVPKVMWFKGSDIITSGNNYEIIDDGKKHILIINNCEFDDEGEYTIEVLGKTSAAKLTVEGKWLSFLFMVFIFAITKSYLTFSLQNHGITLFKETCYKLK